MTIVTYPSDVLSQRAEKVTAFDESLRTIAQQMFQTMVDGQGVGLAAPQVGLSIQLCVIHIPEDPHGEVALVNPEIVHAEGRQTGEEGCLSFPGIFIDVQRAMRVRVRYQDLDGQPQEIEGEGLLARALQHEIDHLNGVLLVNKMTTIQRLANRRSLEMLRRRTASAPQEAAEAAQATAPGDAPPEAPAHP
ncbi:MAG TPA: peptide deformylase [Phycisphaerae bacterium]|nr:peptide deformylase [Phycisphaerae bacterium]